MKFIDFFLELKSINFRNFSVSTAYVFTYLGVIEKGLILEDMDFLEGYMMTKKFMGLINRIIIVPIGSDLHELMTLIENFSGNELSVIPNASYYGNKNVQIEATINMARKYYKTKIHAIELDLEKGEDALEKAKEDLKNLNDFFHKTIHEFKIFNENVLDDKVTMFDYIFCKLFSSRFKSHDRLESLEFFCNILLFAPMFGGPEIKMPNLKMLSIEFDLGKGHANIGTTLFDFVTKFPNLTHLKIKIYGATTLPRVELVQNIINCLSNCEFKKLIQFSYDDDVYIISKYKRLEQLEKFIENHKKTLKTIIFKASSNFFCCKVDTPEFQKRTFDWITNISMNLISEKYSKYLNLIERSHLVSLFKQYPKLQVLTIEVRDIPVEIFTGHVNIPNSPVLHLKNLKKLILICETIHENFLKHLLDELELLEVVHLYDPCSGTTAKQFVPFFGPCVHNHKRIRELKFVSSEMKKMIFGDLPSLETCTFLRMPSIMFKGRCPNLKIIRTLITDEKNFLLFPNIFDYDSFSGLTRCTGNQIVFSFIVPKVEKWLENVILGFLKVGMNVYITGGNQNFAGMFSKEIKDINHNINRVCTEHLGFKNKFAFVVSNEAWIYGCSVVGHQIPIVGGLQFVCYLYK